MATVIRGSDNWDTALKAGSQAFAARIPSASWFNVAADSVIPFNDVSTGDSFDTGGNFNTSTKIDKHLLWGLYTYRLKY